MNKALLSVFFLSFLFLTISCRKTIKPSDKDKISFLVRLPSIALAKFEVRCVSEDVFLDQVIIQSPSASLLTTEFNHNRYAKNETLLVGNQAVEDGLWLITFIGVSAITNEDFRIIVPYEMLIAVDNEE